MTKLALFATLASVLALPGLAYAQGSAANLAGTYRCTPEPVKCEEQTYMVTQNGTTLQLKDDKGSEFAEAKITSDTTLSAGPTMNSNGLVLPDHSIQWSNGTLWRKQ
jgi:hypothetical protein